MRVSIFENATSVEPQSTNVTSILKAIKDGRWKNQIENIYKGDYEANKKNLPAVTFSGTFKTRKADALESHSGFICLDWDKIDVNELSNKLKADEYIYAFFISPSGKGIKALVKIPTNDHLASFKALEERYPGIDKSGKDVSRLCFVSYDPNLFLNEKSKTFYEQKNGKGEKKTEFFMPVEEGGRNDSLLKSAGKLIAKTDLSKQDIFNILSLQNQGFKEPLSDKEVNQVFQSALRYDTREFTEENIDEILFDAHVNLLEDLPEPPVCTKIRTFEGGKIQRQRLFTLGNFSVSSGKEKSKKTLVGAMLLAANSSNSMISEKFIGCLPPDKRMTMLFDTEQAKYDTHKLGKRILETGGVLDNVNVWCLREHSPKNRIKIIERALERYGKITGFVVIDGIADLVNSINDEEEAKRVVGKLMKWTSRYKVHIHVMIHFSKVYDSPTGHLGSEVNKKAECVIGVKKNEECPERSDVYCQLMRGAPEWSKFEIVIDKGQLRIDSMQNLSSHYEEIEYSY